MNQIFIKCDIFMYMYICIEIESIKIPYKATNYLKKIKLT